MSALPPPDTLAEAGIVLECLGVGSGKRYTLTVNSGTAFAHTRDFRHKGDRDLAAATAWEQAMARRQLAAGPPDFAQVYAQESAKRALEIAAAGGHTILLYGPPGSAKQMLRERMPSIGGTVDQVLTSEYPDRPADIVIQMVPTSEVDMALPPPAETSAAIADRVAAVRGKVPTLALDHAARSLLDEFKRRAPDVPTTSVEAVATTIAALDGETIAVRRLHLAEALAYVRLLAA